MALRRLIAATLAAALAAGSAASCSKREERRPAAAGRGAAGTTAPGETTTTTEPPFDDSDHPRRGSVRVGVWGAPDPGAATLGGAAVRALVLPQLFVAMADGKWRPLLVVPGSDKTAADGRSATLRLRSGSTWSDGHPFGADDLRRTADARFVAGVDGPDAGGVITLRFTQPLPGWRRLWSGTDSVAAPAAGVWGGPFVVAGYTPGLEVVLRRNDGWRGGKGPFLDEVKLVLVPDAVTARQLLARGELDVVMPPAQTVRTPQLRDIPGVDVASASGGGWWVGLFFAPGKAPEGVRRALISALDRERFVGTLLRDEAVVLNGFIGPEDAAWASVGPGDVGSARGAKTVELTGELEEPMTQQVERVLQQRLQAAGTKIELRNAESERVEPWVASGAYAAAVMMTFDSPDVCWRCRWEAVDAALAGAADSGDRAAAAALEAKVRDQALLLPLWRPKTVVAWRGGVNGVRANGYGLSAAWNAWQWWR